MRYFRGNDRDRDRGRGGGRDRGKSSMHKATCSDCGKKCEVPFRPTNSKPVYCSDCFRGHDNDSSGGRDRGRRDGGRDRGRGGYGGGRDRSGRDRGDRQMHKAVCDKCGSNCEVPFRPTGDKPIYCSDCFGNKNQGGRGGSKGGGKSTDHTSKHLEIIDEKLDRIMKALMSDAPAVRHRVEFASKKGKVKRANRSSKAPKLKKVVKKKVAKEKAKKIVKKAAKKKPVVKKKTTKKKK